MGPGDAKRVFDLAVGRSAPPLASMVTIFAISFYSSTLVAQFSIALSFASLFFVLPASIGAIFFSEMSASKDKEQSDSLISLLFWLVFLYAGFCFILVYWLPVISKIKQNPAYRRSEEHTSELQSQSNLVCRLLLEKKKKIK